VVAQLRGPSRSEAFSGRALAPTGTRLPPSFVTITVLTFPTDQYSNDGLRAYLYEETRQQRNLPDKWK
jgi:hypothetical protein